MTSDRGAAALLRSVGLLADGPAAWSRPLPVRSPGVFVIEWPSPPATAPLELSLVGSWIARVESLRLDGERPTSKQLAARLASFWLPGQPVLYVGGSTTSISRRIAAMEKTVLGDRRPHSGGHWLKTLRGLDAARVWWAATDAVEEYEDALLATFAAGVREEERATVVDPETILPFANLRTPSGDRKRTGLTGSLLAEPVEPVRPPTHVVQLPDAAAEGAYGEPPPPRPRAARGTVRPARATASTPGRPAPAPIHLTAEGATKLKAELDELVAGRRPEVIARIRAAKELGDLKENADYTAAREEQSFLEGRIQALEAQLRSAVIVDAPAAGSRIGIGSRVTVETDGTTLAYQIVGSAEADPAAGRISDVSPVGRALLGRTAGDEVTIRTPRGEVRYRIVEIG